MPSGALMLKMEAAHVEPQVRTAALIRRMFEVARAVHPGRSPRDSWRAWGLLMNQIAHRRTLRAWYRGGDGPLQEMLAWRPSLVLAVNRPYVSSEWSAECRLAAIEAHYQLIAGAANCLRLAPHGVANLATIHARESVVEIVLDSPAWFVHEGELTLNIFSRGERIYTLAFSLGTEAGRTVAYVGALQGYGREQALEIYRKLTHAMHGLRPRELLLAAFRMLCRELGVQRILCVSDAQRVSASAYFRGEERVQSSYDVVWNEHHGVPRPDGFFELPLEVARRTHESIPSRKRSEYRQRYALLDRLDADLSRALRARAQA